MKKSFKLEDLDCANCAANKCIANVEPDCRVILK